MSPLSPLYSRIAARLDPPDAVPLPPPAVVDGSRPAAVLLPLFEKDGHPHLLYFVRTMEVPTHKGQICFPGGRYDSTDATLLATALRETHEEIGVPAERVRVLGHLGYQPTASGAFGIAAFVGVLPYPFRWVPDAFEVAEILEVPLHRLCDPTLRRTKDMEWSGATFPVLFYDIHDPPLWGATARITEMFLDRVAPFLPSETPTGRRTPPGPTQP